MEIEEITQKLLHIERFLTTNDIFMAKVRLRQLISKITNTMVKQ